MCSECARPNQALQAFIGVSLPNQRPNMDQIGQMMRHRYELRGLSHSGYVNDVSILRRLGVHPADATVQDMERVVFRARAQSTRANYVRRLRSVYVTLREMGICDNREAEKLPRFKEPRGIPHPLTDDEVETLLAQAGEPYRDWFILACFAGLRAMEIAGLRGEDLVRENAGWSLWVRGKGGTLLTVPAHPLVVEMMQKYPAVGPLWGVSASWVSHRGGREMKRLGVNQGIHACRHWFATTALAATNGDIFSVSKLLRHASVTTTMVYAQLGDDKPRAAVLAMATPLPKQRGHMTSRSNRSAYTDLRTGT